MGEFGDSPGKQAVRGLWNTPLLIYLYQTYQMRFRYMGLPGVDLLDLKLWKKMIHEVVAFETRAKPNENDPLGRRSIVELRRNLQLLGIPGRAYFGSMEEVLTLREDYEGTEYKQDKLITLYNLDFCGQIESEIDTAKPSEKISRFEAIRQMLLDQQECYKRNGGPGFFLILLTVRNQMNAIKLNSFLSKNPHYDTQSYIDICNQLDPLPAAGQIKGTHTWALKAFIHDLLRHYLTHPIISAIFFPIVKYTGKTRSSPMLHFMVLCRFDEPQLHSPLFLPQNYLTATSSVRAHDQQTLLWEPEPGETSQANYPPNAEQWLKDMSPSILQGRGIKKWIQLPREEKERI